MAEILYPFTEDGLTDALKALGRTPESVARNLEAMGFKGYREQCHSCPVAEYLLAVVKDVERVDVATYAKVARTVVEYTTVAEERVTADIPRAVGQFISLFDSGSFPCLDKEKSDASA